MGRHKSMATLKEIILNCRMVYRWVLKICSKVWTQDKSTTYRGLTQQDSNLDCWILTSLDLELLLVDMYADTQIKRDRLLYKVFFSPLRRFII